MPNLSLLPNKKGLQSLLSFVFIGDGTRITCGDPIPSMLQIQNRAASTASSLFYCKATNAVRPFHKTKNHAFRRGFESVVMALGFEPRTACLEDG